jgi:CRISPR-associated endonuclease/helicase Cas3
MRLLAHSQPDEALLDHLRGVGDLTESFLDPLGLGALGKRAGLCHDLGKATRYFQEMLQGQRSKGDPLTWHSLPGALFAAWVAHREGLEEEALLLFLAIRGHHGGLQAPWEWLPAQLSSRKDAWSPLDEQLQALDTPAFRELTAALGLPEPTPFLQGEAWSEARWLAQRASVLLVHRAQDLKLHYRLALLYSALIDADRRLASQRPPFSPAPMPSEAVETYLEIRRVPSPLSAYREELARGVAQALEAPLETLFPARLTLTAPTGAGKTLSALRFALGLRERVSAELRLLPKVIYALPYIAIADQVEEEVRGVLQTAGLDPERHLLVDHHLALARLREGESVEEALLFQETWDRDVVVTTFHQVFPTLVGPGSQLRPFHSLAEGTILILDEVQTLPAELWPLLRALLRQLPGNVTVVSMTATQPRLVDGLELAPRLTDYPQRVRMIWGKARSLEELAEHLLHEGETKSRLVVLNTVREATELYRLLRGECSHLVLLTSHLMPKHRRDRLARIREALKRGIPLTLVATQVVEAGVDLDFQEGYRAFAPLESLL